MDILIRKINKTDLLWTKELFKSRWGGEFIVTRGRIHRPEELFGFIAEVEGKKSGLITYRISNTDVEIITLDSLRKWQGVGTALLNKLISDIKNQHAKRIWLITTNDNMTAQQFWQKRGFRLKNIYKDAMELSRKLKPSIPLIGENDIPITDEIEFEMVMESVR